MSKIALNIELIRRLTAVFFRTTSELTEIISIPTPTWYKIIKNPDLITVNKYYPLLTDYVFPHVACSPHLTSQT